VDQFGNPNYLDRDEAILVATERIAGERRSRRTLRCWHGPLVLDSVEDDRTGRQILKLRGEY
jgi:hypothetical protein